MQQVAVMAPVPADALKALKPFALLGRQTGNECRALTPVIQKIANQSYCQANGKTDEKACPEHAENPQGNDPSP
jgi:hypothetical protein